MVVIKSELIAAVAAHHPDMPVKDVEAGVNAVFAAIGEQLASGGRVELRDFGAFTVRHRAARVGRNPKTGAPVEVQGKWVPFFKAGRELRLRIDGREG